MLHLLPFLGLLAIAIRLLIQRRRKAQARLPPGPRSVLSIQGAAPAPQWIILDKLSERYGPLCSFFRGATLVIVISKLNIAWDLLQKRGEIYSSRPRLIIAHDIVSGGMRGLTMPYGKQWRTWRRIQNTGVSGRASLTYRDHQALESAILLRDFLQSPERYEDHITRFAASVTMSVSYGQRMATLDDDVFIRHEQSVKDFQRASIPGNPVELYPSLLYLPRFLQWFRRDADIAYTHGAELYTDLLMDVKKRLETGEARDCMATRGIKDQAAHGLTDLQLAFALSAPFGAGIDTTVGTLEVGLCAILHNPTAARKAQDELDRVVGRARLPNFEDEPALPYLGAFIKEILRWHPVVPQGMPHCTMADDEYEGYHIPKGATVIANIFAMTRDPDMFPDPEVFRPERFLDNEDPRMLEFTLTFGFGRRQCPGMHVAMQSIFTVCARLLWAYDITPVLNDEGAPDILDMDKDWDVLGFTRKPKAFGFVVRPRFEEARTIVEREATEAETLLKAWM